LGEKNNSYFLGLEKQRQVRKSISKLLDENNKVIKEQGEILNTIKDYYEKLYTINLVVLFLNNLFQFQNIYILSNGFPHLFGVTFLLKMTETSPQIYILKLKEIF
jgi:hypothetical protein